MKTRAAVAFEAKRPLEIVELDLEGPKPGEVLIEIMAITLASLDAASIWMQAVIMALVAVGITAAVYGAVALIVKADDAGLALAKRGTGALAAFGRGLVRGMPGFLKALAVVGTAAMVWVGGGIIVRPVACVRIPA